MNIEEQRLLQNKLEGLILEHRDLDDAIRLMEESRASDQIQLKRMKKRKLLLKDNISRLESMLIPDLNA